MTIEYPEPGQVWKLELRRLDGRDDYGDRMVKHYTVMDVEGDLVLFEELLTASRYDSSHREHMAASPDWTRVL